MTGKKYRTEEINIDSTHIHLKTDILNRDIKPVILENRKIVSDEIKRNPQFNGYEPVELIEEPLILKLMTYAGKISNTGPMSSVAGSMSQICLDYLRRYDTKYSIIENGGDIALKTNKESIISIYAGKSIYSDKIAFRIDKQKDGYGICTSSASVGHSKSFGKSDATVVFSKTASIADSLATSIGNSARGDDNEDIVNNALEYAEEYREYYDCVVIIKDDLIAKIGKMPNIININNSNSKDKYNMI